MSTPPAGPAELRKTAEPAGPTDDTRDAGRTAARLVRVTTEPLDVAAHEAAVEDARAGARVVFAGVVRSQDHGRSVQSLHYTAHPSAEQVLDEVADRLAEEPDVLAVAVSHRVGDLLVGDLALVAAVSTAHRQAAFAACARLVNEVKARLPVWKRQVFDDGSDEWVDCP